MKRIITAIAVGMVFGGGVAVAQTGGTGQGTQSPEGQRLPGLLPKDGTQTQGQTQGQQPSGQGSTTLPGLVPQTGQSGSAGSGSGAGQSGQMQPQSPAQTGAGSGDAAKSNAEKDKQAKDAEKKK